MLIIWLRACSIFIFKYDPTLNLDARLEIQRVYPIRRYFSISIAQTYRPQETAELPPNTNPALVKSPSGGHWVMGILVMPTILNWLML